jgi:hypothetical protein
VLHVVVPFVPVTDIPPAGIGSYIAPDELVSGAKKQLDRMIAKALPGKRAASVDAKVVIGDAYQRIIAATRGMDAVVMSTSGRTGLAHLLIGSVARRWSAQPVPVITLRGVWADRLERRVEKTRLTPRMLRLVFALAIGVARRDRDLTSSSRRPHTARFPARCAAAPPPLFRATTASASCAASSRSGRSSSAREPAARRALRLAIPGSRAPLHARRTPRASAPHARARSRGPALRPAASGVGDARSTTPAP